MSDPICLLNEDLAIRPITEKFAAHNFPLLKNLSAEHCKFLIGCLMTWNWDLILEQCGSNLDKAREYYHRANSEKYLKRTKKYKDSKGNTCRVFSLENLPAEHEFFCLVTSDKEKFLSFAISFA